MWSISSFDSHAPQDDRAQLSLLQVEEQRFREPLEGSAL